jgi:adenine phosphoribosyltransferase
MYFFKQNELTTTKMLQNRIKSTIKDVPNFPKEGIIFKDITPLLLDSQLSKDITEAFVEHARTLEVDVICGLESRGFLFGNSIAQALGVPFVLIRKEGKLPRATEAFAYDLEYGSAVLEVHREDIPRGSRVLIHDDLLATGGTAFAAAYLVKKLDAAVVGFSFIVELLFLNGRDRILPFCQNICALVTY